MTRAVFAYSWLFLALCAPAASASGITVTKAWIRYLTPAIPAAGYLLLTNTADQPATLLGATSPACHAGLMLHQSQDTSGMAAMVAVPNIAIAAHSQLALAPGGYHLMCMSPSMKIGDQVPVHLTFQGSQPITVPMRVYGAQEAP